MTILEVKILLFFGGKSFFLVKEESHIYIPQSEAPFDESFLFKAFSDFLGTETIHSLVSESRQVSLKPNLINSPPAKTKMNVYNTTLSHLDKQLSRFNETQKIDEDRTQSFLNKVNAHIITTHHITPENNKSPRRNQNDYDLMASSNSSSYGKMSKSGQTPLKNTSEGFFLHTNVYFQAPNKSKCN